MSQPGTAANRPYEAVWRIESARVIAALARRTGDVGLAEDLAHDAFVSALEQWPVSGVPNNPGAWLVAVGNRRWFDTLRRKGTLEGKQPDLNHQAEVRQHFSCTDFDDVEEEVGDDRLRLIFTACHPVLSQEARVALTLRLVAGLTTGEIARAYLIREPTVAQRVVRAKRSLSEAGVLLSSRPPASSRSAWTRYWKSFTWCSTRATPRPAVSSGRGRAGRGPPVGPHHRPSVAG